jgi:hypothetical protein
MATDYIRYDILTQDALRGVVRAVLADAAAKGLPGDHHFFVSFDTRADGVGLSPRLREQYPEEMTIVLQHQFWDLTVGDDVFEVGLSFNGVPERLTVPLAAIKGFFDPSVQFGLQFALASENADEQSSAAASPAAIGSNAADSRPPARKERPAGTPAEPVPTVAVTTPSNPDEPPPQGGGEVVRLDRFRKK